MTDYLACFGPNARVFDSLEEAEITAEWEAHQRRLLLMRREVPAQVPPMPWDCESL